MSGSLYHTCTVCGEKTSWYRDRRNRITRICIHEDPRIGKKCPASKTPLHEQMGATKMPSD